MRLFDADVRLGESIYGYGLDLATLRNNMDRLDIGRVVLSSVRPKDYDVRAGNDVVLDAVTSDPDRFVGFARVDPWQGDDAIGEIERTVRHDGLRGVFLDPWEDHFTAADPMLDPIVDTAVRLGVPIMIAGGYPQFSHPSQIAALARRHSDATIIATHGGQINISGLLLGDAQIMLRTAPNVIINTSGVYREDYIEDSIAEFGTHRVVFGSGAPIFDQSFETQRVHRAHVDDSIKQQIGWDNIARLVE